MLSNTFRASRAFSSASRLLHTTSVVASQSSGRDSRISQGSVSKAGHNHSGDPHDQVARRGQDVGHGQQHSTTPYDAASRANDKKADRSGFSGNKEGVGFAEQVGSASATANKDEPRPSPGEGMGGQEESTPPGFVASLKSKLGLDTSTGEVKQNRGGGVGVTGTGALPSERKPQDGRRPYHTSPVIAADQIRGQAPEASRQPKDRAYGEQNAHLKHKSSTAAPDRGKGNAADEPKLPSHEGSPSGTSNQKRAFSTSSCRSKQHTADSYFKDVDDTPPSSQKTHQVDNSGTGSDVQRPNEPLTGEFSRAGARTKEYETVSQRDKYDVPPSSGPEKEEKLRYGNMPGYSSADSSDSSVSKGGEGPEGASQGGRKPEGRS